MQTFCIGDGIKLNILPSDKFKTNFLSVSFITPLTLSDASNTALLSRVLLRACKKYPSTALLCSRLEYLYDMSVSMRSYKRGELLVTSYESEFLKDDYVPSQTESLLSEAVEFFRETVYNPLASDGCFDADITAQEKTDLINTINSLINNKNAYAKQKCTSLMCENEKYAVYESGDVETVSGITPKALYEYYREFVKNAVIEIYFVGECDAAALKMLFEKVFEKTLRTPVELPETFVTDTVHEPVVEKEESMDVSQGKLAMGFRTGVTLKANNSAAFALFCEIFGGSPVSKLFLNVREKLSLCYYCRSMPDSFKGVMFILSGIENTNKDKAVKAILKELDDMKNGVFSDEDVENAKLSMTNAYKELEDNCSGLVAWYLSRRLFGDNSTLTEAAERIKHVTKKEIATAAKNARLDTVYFLKGTDAEAEE